MSELLLPTKARSTQLSLYEEFVPRYLIFVRHHRGRRTTQQLEDCLLRFFAWLKWRCVDDLKGLTAGHIRAFLDCFGHFARATIATNASALRGFLRYLHMQGVLSVELAYAVEVPRLYRRSRPPQVLTEKDVERLLAAVDRSTALGKRDYAMLVLAARCGLRPSDIRQLRFEYIHWREQRIVFVQSKTQRKLELPLLIEVDHALVDYIRTGRPECSAREIFVRHTAPIRPFASRNNLHGVMDRGLHAAGLELPGHRSGLYLLRHSLATRMLGCGVRLDTISDVLGHVSVDTTLSYTQVDMVQLRSVSLSEGEVRR
jgi:site-specific recombinase XerD